jgi:hypothetical protein
MLINVSDGAYEVNILNTINVSSELKACSAAHNQG